MARSFSEWIVRQFLLAVLSTPARAVRRRIATKPRGVLGGLASRVVGADGDKGSMLMMQRLVGDAEAAKGRAATAFAAGDISTGAAECEVAFRHWRVAMLLAQRLA